MAISACVESVIIVVLCAFWFCLTLLMVAFSLLDACEKIR